MSRAHAGSLEAFMTAGRLLSKGLGIATVSAGFSLVGPGLDGTGRGSRASATARRAAARGRRASNSRPYPSSEFGGHPLACLCSGERSMRSCVRMSSFLGWLFSLGILLPASLAGAAEAPVQITLEQALSAALDRNPTLSVERRELDIDESARRQAGIYPFNPEIEAGGGAGQGRNRGGADESRGINTTSVGLSQTIWLKGQRGLRVRSADAGVLRAQSLVQDAERQVVADTLKTYSDLLVSQERVSLAREILGVVRQVQDAAQKLFEIARELGLEIFVHD